MWNAILDHKMSFEIKHTISIISGSNWEILKHIELQPIYPYAYKKKTSVELNISWPSNFYEKNFMAPLIYFSLSFKSLLS